MSLVDTIKELKDQLAEEDKKEVENPEIEVEAEEKKEDPKEEAKEEIKEEKKEEPEDKPDANAYQRMRREKAAAEKREQDKDREIESLKAKLAEPKEEKEEREQPAIVPELEEIVIDHRMKQAEKEFTTLESNFKRSNPEYDGVAAEYAMALAQSIKIQNPRLNNNEVAEKTKKTILFKAATFMDKGFDPIEELYHEAKELGFNGNSFKKTEQKQDKEETEVRPDMKKVAENRKKSTGMAATSGKSEGQITKQAAGDFTVAEWKKLPPSEKRRLMYQ